MKLIIAGSRNIDPYLGLIDTAVSFLKPQRDDVIKEIVSGGAQGVDDAGAHWGEHMGAKVKYFRADWGKHGKAAGPIRNAEMAEYGDALLLIWDGESRGSASMKREMQKLDKPVYEVILRGNE